MCYNFLCRDVQFKGRVFIYYAPCKTPVLGKAPLVTLERVKRPVVRLDSRNDQRSKGRFVLAREAIMITVYKITNLRNGKGYIGITKHSAEKRWRRHLKDANKRKHLPLYAAILKYGEGAFSVRTLATVDTWDAAQGLEISFIKRYGTHTSTRNGYNMTWGGDGSLGLKPNEEARKKMSMAQRGRRHTEETKRKIGLAHKGNTYGSLTKGFKMSEAQKRLLSFLARGRRASEETRQKMSASQRGRKHSEETKQKISRANKGKKFSKSHRQKLSQMAKERDCSHLYRPVKIDGIVYESRTAAANAHGVSLSSITRWIKIGKAQDV